MAFQARRVKTFEKRAPAVVSYRNLEISTHFTDLRWAAKKNS